MRRFPLFCVSIAALVVPAIAWATSTSGNLAINVTAAASSSSCPQGTAYPDGCSAAPAGTPQLPSLFSAPFAPHSSKYAVSPPWNVPGVEYHVGITSGTTLKDPTAGGLPSGASYSSSAHAVTVSGTSSVTLDGWNFCNPAGSPNGVHLHVATTGGTTTVQNSRFCTNSSFAANWGENLLWDTSGAALIYQYNECSGTPGLSSGNVDSACIEDSVGAPITVQYNYAHDRESKVYRFDADYPDASHSVTFKYNATIGFGLNNVGVHSEEAFQCGPSPARHVGQIFAYNLSVTALWPASFGPTNTANYSIGDPTCGEPWTQHAMTISNNVLIASGTNQSGQTAAQNIDMGCNQGYTPCDSNILQNNYFDFWGAYSAYYGTSFQGPYPLSFAPGGVSGNLDLVTGGNCDPPSWQITGGGTGRGGC
jgi:hypothetical protein